MDFHRTPTSLTVTQCKYIDDIDIIDNNNMHCNTPMLNTMNLRTAAANNNNSSLLPITGKLRFVADRCRPDVLVATGEIFRGGDKNPS